MEVNRCRLADQAAGQPQATGTVEEVFQREAMLPKRVGLPRARPAQFFRSSRVAYSAPPRDLRGDRFAFGGYRGNRAYARLEAALFDATGDLPGHFRRHGDCSTAPGCRDCSSEDLQDSFRRPANHRLVTRDQHRALDQLRMSGHCLDDGLFAKTGLIQAEGLVFVLPGPQQLAGGNWPGSLSARRRSAGTPDSAPLAVPGRGLRAVRALRGISSSADCATGSVRSCQGSHGR